MDKIIIKGLKIFAFHGVNPEEQKNGQLFVLDIEAHANLHKACETDNIEDTVSYAKIIKTVQYVVTSQKDFLLEHVAQRVATALLEEYNRLDMVEVTIKKPNAPINADFEYTAVNIIRGRDSLE